MKAINTYLKIICLVFILASSSLLAQWEQCSIPFYSYGVLGMSFNGNKIVAGTKKGVFVSTNNGTSWKSTGIKEKISTVFLKGDKILISNDQAKGLFLSSNNGEGWVNVSPDNLATYSIKNSGEYILTRTNSLDMISVDDGYTWHLTGGNLGRINDKKSFEIIGHNILEISDYYIMISTDGGLNWSKTANGLDNLFINCYAVSEGDVYVGTTKGIYVSTDQGYNWIAQNTGLPDKSNIDKLVANGNRIFAFNLTNRVTYLSNNSGKTWSNVSSVIPNINITNIFINEKNLFIATYQKGLYTSTNNGVSWSQAGMNNLTINSFYANGSRIFAAATEGLYFSDGDGNSWALSRFNVPNITYLSTNNTSIVALSGNSGYLSTNNGDRWTQLSVKFNSYTYPVIDSDTLYVAKGGRVLFSTDNGTSWNNDGTDPDSITNAISAFAICEGRILASKKDGVYISKDKGLTWELSNKGLDNNIISNYGVYTHYILGVTSNGLYLSKDYGSNWEMVNNGLPSSQIRCIAISDNNLFAGTNGDGAWISKDFGNSWQEMNIGLEDKNINGIAVSGNLVFAATQKKGLFLSSDYGSSWKTANDGLDTTVNCVAMNKDFVFSGTNGNSLLRANISGFHNTLSVSAKQLTITSKANSTQTFDVVSETSWTVESDRNWLNVSKESGTGNDKITLTAQENILNKQRNATITIKGTNEFKKTLYVIQLAAAPFIIVATDTIKFTTFDSSSQTFDIKSNTYWNMLFSKAWINISNSNGLENAKVTISVNKNSDLETRMTTIKILGNKPAQKIIYIIQEGAAPYLTVSTNSLTIEDAIDSQQEFQINSNASWTVQSDYSWLGVEYPSFGSGSSPVKLIALEENPDKASRDAIVSIVSPGIDTQRVIVTQEPYTKKLWKQCNGPNASPNSIAINDEGIFVGLDYVYFSTDYGESWKQVSSASNANDITCLAAIGKSVFAGTYSNGVLLTTNNGVTWVKVNSGLTTLTIFSMAIFGNTIYIGTYDKCYKSNNNGNSWKLINSSLAKKMVNCFASSGKNIYAGTIDGVYKSTDEGESWALVSMGINSKDINCLAVNGNNVYGGTYSGEVFFSSDNGLSWSLFFNSKLTNYQRISSIAIIGNNIFVGTLGEGVYLSTNNGQNWNLANRGLRGKNIKFLTISGNNIFAGTNFNALFKGNLSDFPLSIEEPEQETSSPLSLFPNPAQNSLNIRLGEESALSSSVRVLDVCGRTVAESKIPAGSKELTLDLKKLPVGIYLLNVMSGNSVKTQKFAVCR